MNIENSGIDGFLKCGHTSVLQAPSRGLPGIEAELPQTGPSLAVGGAALSGREEMMSQDELMVQEETVKNDEEDVDPQERLLPPGFQYTVSGRPSETLPLPLFSHKNCVMCERNVNLKNMTSLSSVAG